MVSSSLFLRGSRMRGGERREAPCTSAAVHVSCASVDYLGGFPPRRLLKHVRYLVGRYGRLHHGGHPVDAVHVPERAQRHGQERAHQCRRHRAALQWRKNCLHIRFSPTARRPAHHANSTDISLLTSRSTRISTATPISASKTPTRRCRSAISANPSSALFQPSKHCS